MEEKNRGSFDGEGKVVVGGARLKWRRGWQKERRRWQEEGRWERKGGRGERSEAVGWAEVDPTNVKLNHVNVISRYLFLFCFLYIMDHKIIVCLLFYNLCALLTSVLKHEYLSSKQKYIEINIVWLLVVPSVPTQDLLIAKGYYRFRWVPNHPCILLHIKTVGDLVGSKANPQKQKSQATHLGYIKSLLQ